MINEQGGINGRKINFIRRDEDPAGSAEAIMSFASAKYGRKELIRAPPS
jgi:ABC-type branched-subunit amino acid transport system substrate-binding protein